MTTVAEKYAQAKEQYAQIGVDTDAALKKLQDVKISMHCWQGDDVTGFLFPDGDLTGGIMSTGNYPGAAHTSQELRQDLEKAFSLIPGKHKLNLHAIYLDTDVELLHSIDNLLNNALELKVVGIVRPNSTTLSTQENYGSIWYTSELTEYVVDKINATAIAQEQLDNPNLNVFTGLEFSNEEFKIEDLSAATDDGGYKKFVWYMPENLRDTKTGLTEMTERTLAQTDGKASYIQINGVENTELKSVSYNILLGDPNTNMGDFNVRHNHVYTVTVDLVGANTADSRLEVVDAYMDNCAMVVPNSGDAGAAVFNLKKMTAGWVTEVPKSNMRASILWQDAKGMMTNDNVKLDIAKGTLTVKSTNNIVGNAVVAVYNSANDGEGEILWSWHVWVTEYHPDGSQNYGLGENSKAIVPGGQVHTYGPEYMKVNPGKVMMDRNLGATKTYNDGNVPQAGDTEADKAFGLLYQWGRKDAFPGADGSTVTLTTGAVTTIPIYGADGNALTENGTGLKFINITTLGVINNNALVYSIKNPLSIIYNTTSPQDWYSNTDTHNNSLWLPSRKTNYDPCPSGWRLPSEEIWFDFLTNDKFPYYSQGVQQESSTGYYATNGRLYAQLTWFPISGCRPSISGLVSECGKTCYYWTATSLDNNSKYFALTFNKANIGEGGHRAGGLSVRCVQE